MYACHNQLVYRQIISGSPCGSRIRFHIDLHLWRNKPFIKSCLFSTILYEKISLHGVTTKTQGDICKSKLYTIDFDLKKNEKNAEFHYR